jgi:hypothetical protein
VFLHIRIYPQSNFAASNCHNQKAAFSISMTNRRIRRIALHLRQPRCAKTRGSRIA